MDNEQLIKDLVKQGESGQLEFKTVVHKDSIAKNLCAFLNADGGRVIVGVGDNGEIIGIKNAVAQKKEIQDFLVNAIVPDAPITISVEIVNQKEILIFKVWGGSKQPYIYDGSIFLEKETKLIKQLQKRLLN
nr:hypothetical protein BACY1_02520 [Tenacibaculum mesophilum]